MLGAGIYRLTITTHSRNNDDLNFGSAGAQDENRTHDLRITRTLDWYKVEHCGSDFPCGAIARAVMLHNFFEKKMYRRLWSLCDSE